MPLKEGYSKIEILEKEFKEMRIISQQQTAHLLASSKENIESILLLRQQMETLIQVLERMQKKKPRRDRPEAIQTRESHL